MRRELLLREMRDAAVTIRDLVGDRSPAQIDDDAMRRSALLWHFNVLVEAASRIPAETRDAYPQIAWVSAPQAETRSPPSAYCTECDACLEVRHADGLVSGRADSLLWRHKYRPLCPAHELTRVGFLVRGGAELERQTARLAYSKPHLTYEEQLQLLESRGLACHDRERGVALLRAVGYYRLSAYVYPFRLPLPEEHNCCASPVHFRSDQVVAGTTVEHVEALWKFDRRLRSRILEGMETVEIGLRTQVAHIVGARDPYGHLDRSALDDRACSKKIGKAGDDAFDVWVQRHQKLLESARSEDYVRHHLAKYDTKRGLPIWITVEYLDFGALTRLYGLLRPREKNAIARELGLAKGSGPLLEGWLRSLNYLRNLCAHHGRVWNRRLTVKIANFHPAQVTGQALDHVATLEAPAGIRIYRTLAITAHLIQWIDPGSRWHAHISEQVKRFPDVPGLSPLFDMGFPDGWQSLILWQPSSHLGTAA